jgi:cysteine desulfurase
LVEQSRRKILTSLNAGDKYQIVFTSTGTESNNIALRGLEDYRIAVSEIEHSSVFKIPGFGHIPVNENGTIDLNAVEKLAKSLEGEKFIVSIMAANNETGVIQPLKEAAEIIHQYGGLIHSDCIQAYGKIALDISDLDLDIMSISSHKIFGPQGSAALIYKKNLPIKGLTTGGGQEYGVRSGSHNTLSIYGFGVAGDFATKNLDSYNQQCSQLRDHLETQIAQISPDTVFYGNEAQRLPNTSSFTMPNVLNDLQIVHFDMNGFSVSAGSACSSGKMDLPRVQMSMGYPEEVARTSIRVSLSPDNTKEEIDRFVTFWKELYQKHNINKNRAA